MMRVDPILFVIVVLVAATFITLWYFERKRARAAEAEIKPLSRELVRQTALVQQVVEVAGDRQRYQIEVSDWGEDFTGEDGALHRFRWVVSDADRDIRKAVTRSSEEANEPTYLMLGNEPTSMEAWSKAMAWVEQQQYPPVIVVGGRHD